MAGSEAHSGTVRLGGYELDVAARELRKNGVSVHLQDQPWEVLRALVERPGEVVSREELRRRLWPDGTFVDYEQSLNKAVNKLREALCDSADKPRYVETVARRGYRFVGAVEVAAAKKVVGSHRRRWWVAGALGLVGAGVVVTGLWPVPALRVRITQLTNGGRPKGEGLAVHGGRILFQSQSPPPNIFAAEFWTISTSGGEPKRERMPFLNPVYGAELTQVNLRQGDIQLAAGATMALRGEVWLAGFDGSRARRIGETVVGE